MDQCNPCSGVQESPYLTRYTMPQQRYESRFHKKGNASSMVSARLVSKPEIFLPLL